MKGGFIDKSNAQEIYIGNYRQKYLDEIKTNVNRAQILNFYFNDTVNRYD